MAYRRASYRTARKSYARPARRSYSKRRAAPSRARNEIRLVIQTPSDMLPARPVVGQFARARRRARF